MGWGLGSLVPVGSHFSVPCVESEADLPLPAPLSAPKPWELAASACWTRGTRAPKCHLALVEVCAPGRVLPRTPAKHGLSHRPNRSQAEIPMQSPGNAPLPLPKASCSPVWKLGGSSLSALRANSSHQLIALFPRPIALAAGSQLAGGYRYFMQTWRETSPVSHSQGVAPKQHRDLSQHICGICANWPDCLNNSVYIYKL